MASAVFRTSCSRISNSEELCDVCKVEAGKLADVKLAVDITALLPLKILPSVILYSFFFITITEVSILETQKIY
jgi:hypothetical protein